jgi:hypothetical protein
MKIPVKPPSAAVKLFRKLKERSRALERCLAFDDDMFSYRIGQSVSTDASFSSRGDCSSISVSSHGGVVRDIDS